MNNDTPIPASLAIDAFTVDARNAFDIAADARYHGIAFATNHPELMPDQLGHTARRHLKTMLAGKRLEIDAIRIAAPKGALTDPTTIDRTLDGAQKAFLLARDLGVKVVSLNVGNLVDNKVPHSTLIAAIRQLAQHADAVGGGELTVSLSGDASEPLRSMLKEVDYDRAAANLDTANTLAAGEDILLAAEALAGVIGQLTAADVIRAGKTIRPTCLGEGQLPLHELLEILADQGFRGPMVVDVRDLPDGEAGARHAANVLRKLLS
ncbi:MAG: sugar phosphate isomerase/epimerase [Phycisphaerales bacterium]|nr:sugar phosphate isomerase/epimerase [Phycisphaerales bacterium]